MFDFFLCAVATFSKQNKHEFESSAFLIDMCISFFCYMFKRLEHLEPRTQEGMNTPGHHNITNHKHLNCNYQRTT